MTGIWLVNRFSLSIFKKLRPTRSGKSVSDSIQDLQPVHCGITLQISTQLNFKMGLRDHYNVYVIELSKDVLLEGRFKKGNADYVARKLCIPNYWCSAAKMQIVLYNPFYAALQHK